MNPVALKFLIVASYTGAVIPMLIAVLIPYIRRAISRGTWITLSVFVAIHAISFIPYFIASHQNNPSALEALWIPMPLGVLLFFFTSFIVLVHAIPDRGPRDPKGEQDVDRKPDDVPS